jgi:hypothetical protein
MRLLTLLLSPPSPLFSLLLLPGTMPVLKALVDAGGDVNAATNAGRTPLIALAQSGVRCTLKLFPLQLCACVCVCVCMCMRMCVYVCLSVLLCLSECQCVRMCAGV